MNRVVLNATSSTYFSIFLWRSRSTWRVATRNIRYSDISSFGLDIRVAVRAYRIDYEHEKEHEHDEMGDYLCKSVLIRGKMTADMDSRLAIDTAVLLLYFIVIIWIGLYMGRKEDNLKDFALGGRAIPWWAVLASIIAAETSAATFFGTPGEGFHDRNYTYVQLAIGTILARILVSYIFIKPYYDYKVYSIYEYLTARFGVPTKNAASAVFLITRVLASGARLYVAAIALALAYEMIR